MRMFSYILENILSCLDPGLRRWIKPETSGGDVLDGVLVSKDIACVPARGLSITIYTC